MFTHDGSKQRTSTRVGIVHQRCLDALRINALSMELGMIIENLFGAVGHPGVMPSAKPANPALEAE